MPSPSAPRRRDLRRWEKRRRRSKVRPRRVLLGTVLVSGLLGAASALNPFATSDLSSTRSDAMGVGALVERASEAVSRGLDRGTTDAADDTAETPAGATPTATTAAEPSPAPASSVAAEGDGTATATPQAAIPAESSAPPVAAPAPAATEPAAEAAPATEVSATVALAQEIVVATNAERRKAGLGELAVDECATSMAVLRTERLVAEGRFEHDPLGEIVDACGIGTLGENLALGYPTATAVLAGWMGSEGHRANILRPGYSQIGVGCTSGPKGMLCGQVFLG